MLYINIYTYFIYKYICAYTPTASSSHYSWLETKNRLISYLTDASIQH